MYSKTLCKHWLILYTQPQRHNFKYKHRSSFITKKAVKIPNGCQLPRCSFCAGARYSSHLYAPQLRQEKAHRLKYKWTLPSESYCLYVPRHRDLKGCFHTHNGGERGLFLKWHVQCILHVSFPATFIYLLAACYISHKN